MGHSLYAARHARFAGLRVRLRPHAPRHPPRTLVCRVENNTVSCAAVGHPEMLGLSAKLK